MLFLLLPQRPPPAPITGLQERIEGLHEVNCWFITSVSSPLIRCYFMVVKETPGNNGAPLIAFPVLKFTPFNADKEDYPILHLGGGGPGSPMGLSAHEITDAIPAGDGASEGYYQLWQSYAKLYQTARRVFYVIDPRGVGIADPLLSCPEILTALRVGLQEAMTGAAEVNRQIAAARRCRERLKSAGHNLASYHSAQVGHDVEQLRQALGVAQWHLYGVSYGSRYALTIARDYPASVATMVLDSPTFPNVDYITRAAEIDQRAFERALGWCRRGNACSPRWYDLEGRFWRLVEQLAAAPITVSTTDPFTGEALRVVLTGERLLQAIYMAIYDASFIELLPTLVEGLEAGDGKAAELAVINLIYFWLDPHYADAVSYSHFCYEEHPFIDYKAALEGAQRIANRHLRQATTQGIEAARVGCRVWAIPAAPPLEGQLMTTAIPTLFLQGALDPVLPVEILMEQLDHFTHHKLLIFEEIAHGVIPTEPCAAEAAGLFIRHQRLLDDEPLLCQSAIRRVTP